MAIPNNGSFYFPYSNYGTNTYSDNGNWTLNGNSFLTNNNGTNTLGWNFNSPSNASFLTGTFSNELSPLSLEAERLNLAKGMFDLANKNSWLAPAGFGLQLGGTLANAFLGWNNMNQAKKALNFQMDMAKKNFNNNITMLEDARNDRWNNRSAFEGTDIEHSKDLERV